VKIIYLHQYFTTPGMSGGTRSYEMARRMVDAGHEVHMVTARSDLDCASKDWEIETVSGIQVHWLPVPYDNAMSYFRRLLAFTAFARKAGDYAARLNGDVVFATSTPLTICIPGVKVSRKLGVPMVFEVRDLWPELPIAMGALNFPFGKAVAKKLERWAYKNSARVVGLSPGICEGVERAGFPAEKTVCIPNSSDVELFSVPDSEGHAFRAKREWLGTNKLVIYAGTFGRINGVGALVDIAAEMKKLDSSVKFLAVGRGAEFDLVEEKAREKGVLGGNFFMEKAIPKSEIPSLFNAATVCTSLFIPLEPMWNNSANKFFDALAAGRPVMINYGGWQSKLLSEHQAGLSVSHEDPKAAAVELYQFLQNEPALAEAGKNAFKLATEQFSRDRLAAQLIRVLEEVVSECND